MANVTTSAANVIKYNSYTFGFLFFLPSWKTSATLSTSRTKQADNVVMLQTDQRQAYGQKTNRFRPFKIKANLQQRAQQNRMMYANKDSSLGRQCLLKNIPCVAKV